MPWDKVRLGKAPDDYKLPQRFFDRTFLTENLTGLGAEVLRRLAGITTETSAVFNMSTQFGGGKTHALTLLYHLASNGSAANGYRGVGKILQRAGITGVPEHCAVAVFVGTEFDSITGRGGADGTPRRRTPWGEIAWQLGGADAFTQVATHDAEFIDPKGDVIGQCLPADRPCLILLDEVLNYISTYRERGWHNKLYNFIQALSETVRGRHNAVLVGSIPASELSYTDQDHADQQRLKNLLDRLGKAVIVSVEAETAEIIRRRLFEWDEHAVTQDGRVLVPKEAYDTCKAYAEWVQAHRQQLPALINPDLAREQFLATYPFHPMVISVFERKWQTLPRFQRTRGILRLLALWVARAYQDGYKGARRDPLITLGTAPLEDSLFRAAVFEQLGETRLEPAVTTDITGKKDAHAIRLDSEAVDAIRKARLHRKVATAIFFESNGGQVGAEAKEASLPELRLAVGEPELDLGHTETVLEALTEACYYLSVEKTRYKFSLRENLNKRFADRRATIQGEQIDEEVKREIQKVFAAKPFIERIFFPDRNTPIADRPVLTVLIGDLSRTLEEAQTTLAWVERLTRDCGASARTFKSALLWMLPASAQPMREEARKRLAWQAIADEADALRLDEAQKKQLQENLQRARRDLKEAIWRSYKYVVLLAKDNTLKVVDLGLVHSSAADSPLSNLLNRLTTDGDMEKGVSPNFLVRHWPPAFREWSTKAVRDAFYASPVFPRMLNAEALKDTLARGIEQGLLAYVGKTTNGRYQPFCFKQRISSTDIEWSDEMYIISAEAAQAYLDHLSIETGSGKGSQTKGQETTTTDSTTTATTTTATIKGTESDTVDDTQVAGLSWAGEVPSQKWMNFYTKVLSRFASKPGLKLSIQIEINPTEGISSHTVEDTRNALCELGLDDRSLTTHVTKE